jgi:dTDP-4-dehydrorhamnose 3,5-epimerase
MKFRPLEMAGAYAIEPERREDDRGFFARIYCAEEFSRYGLNIHVVQTNLAYTRRRGTIRGIHYQLFPKAETKLVRCTAGGIYDVILDLRPDSPTFRQWIGTELTAQNRSMIYIPEGVAHGYQALTDHAEVSYHVTEFYAAEYERGVRWNDGAFGIAWPEPVTVISEKDRSYPDFDWSKTGG